jgi:hypothetical protein
MRKYSENTERRTMPEALPKAVIARRLCDQAIYI